MAKNEEEIKSLLMRVKEESEKADLKYPFKKLRHGIWSYHFMANSKGNVEEVTDFIFLGSKITGDTDSSHKIKIPWKS